MTYNEKSQTYKEARILSLMKHPNIVLFKEVYITKANKLCIVMDYADGGDLEIRIKEEKNKREYFSEK